MSSDPDLSDSLSREGSFFSLDSGNSVYTTARESLATSTSDEERNQIAARKSHASSTSLGSTTTIGGDSVTSSEYLEMDVETEENGSNSPLITSTTNGTTPEDEETEFELKADVSKICNDIAEAIQPDTKKKAEINLSVASHSAASLRELRKLAISDNGLLSNILRKRAWPALLGISKKDIESLENTKIPTTGENVTREIKNLVNMDVARVLKRFPPGLSDPQQDHLQLYLSKLIIAVLNKNPHAYYYQGFHDISLTFLLVCMSQGAPYLAFLCLDKMIDTCLAPFMEKTMESTHDLIHVLFAIIETEDIDLFNKIVKDSKCPAAFCIPWVLTWFAHTLPSDNDIFRLYDFILGCMDQVNPSYLIPIYISAALVLRNATKIKKIRENDIATMHHTLALLPSQEDSLEPWLKDSSKLIKSYKGKEMQLVGRAVHIKELQNQLWDADSNTNRTSASANRRGGVIASIGKFIFVKHRWYSLAFVALGSAVVIQMKYGSNIDPNLLSAFEKYIPESVKSFYREYLDFPRV